MSRYLPNNVANYLDAGDSALAQTTGIPFTAQIWAKMFTTSGAPKLFSKWGIGSNQHEWLMTLSAGGAWQVWTMTSGGVNYTSVDGSTARARVWQHVLMRQDSSGLYIFVDGKQAGSNTPARSMNDTSNRVLIGRGEDGGPADAYLAHGAYWNDSLPLTAILELANGRDPRTVDYGHLRGYWKGNGYQAEHDWSGRNNAATMQGTVRAVMDNDEPYYDLRHVPVQQGYYSPVIRGGILSAPGVPLSG